MWTYVTGTFLIIISIICEQNAEEFSMVDELSDLKHQLAWKDYPKSDYGYKHSFYHCMCPKNDSSYKRINDQQVSYRYGSKSSKRPTTCSNSHSICEEKAKYCEKLSSCGYGHPHAWDGRGPNPYFYTGTGYLQTGCYPRDYISSNGTHYCDRPCNGEKRICYYRLNVQTTEAHHPYYCSQKCERDKNCPSEKCIRTNGIRTVLMTYNEQLPGPLIAVCAGDTVVVDVVNHLNDFKQVVISDKAIERSVRTDIKLFKVKDADDAVPRIAQEIFLRQIRHKHNRQQSSAVNSTSKSTQAATKSGDVIVVPDYSKPGEPTTVHFHGVLMDTHPQSDGPTDTQYEIPYGSVYRHVFRVNYVSTMFYHSHTNLQRSLGVYGPMFVGDVYEANCHLYDISDNGLFAIIFDLGDNNSHGLDFIFINKHGCNLTENAKHPGFLTVYNVLPNKRYRYRIISNGINSSKFVCYLHGMRVLLIAIDGHPIKPVWIESWTLANGERAEIVIEFTQVTNVVMECFPTSKPTLRQFAVFHVKGAPKTPTCREVKSEPVPQGLQYNTDNSQPGTNGTITTSELEGLIDFHELCRPAILPQSFIVMTISRKGIQINNITNESPSVPFLCQYYKNGYINETNTCNPESLKAQGIDCGAPNVTCRCPHLIKRLVNTCDEVILLGNHPAHRHADAFYVVAQGKTKDNTPITPEKFKELDSAGLVKRNLRNPPLKDTVTTPTNGYTVIRMIHLNPGFWRMHCHIELHGASGMSFTYWVQDPNETHEQFKKRLGKHTCEPFDNNACKGKYDKLTKEN